ncbi:D-lactaldehyde dehydrogenase [Cyathus striatus]|nr:D-lactaldehyde dehydrogenase [Cyathus striatus]
MPAIKPGSKVLVTGANGFLAIWVVQKLLERGCSVRGTVRSGCKGTYLTEFFKIFGDRFELAIVPNMVEEGAFDTALVGVSGVLHVATPLPSAQLEDPDEYIKPAVGGTLGIMRSALNSLEVKRVIYTSSTGTMMREVSEPTILSDKDWNDEALECVKREGKKASDSMKCFASKVLAEEAAWDFYEKNKESSPYDFLVIHLPFIFGVRASINIWYEHCIANPDGPRTDDMLAIARNWVDVRDLADAHVTALEKEKAAGERIIVVCVDVANQAQAQYSISLSQPLPKGKPGITTKYGISYDTSKEAYLLGTNFRDIRETTKDTLEVIARNGW